MQPTTFVQQMNTVSALVQGRVSFNIVAGSSSEEQRGYGDYLSHDERYARAEEFLAVCNAFWRAKVRSTSKANTIASNRQNSRRRLSRRDQAIAGDLRVGSLGTVGTARLVAGNVLVARCGESGEVAADRSAHARARDRSLSALLFVMPAHARRSDQSRAESVARDAKESTTTMKDDSQMYREGNELKSERYWPEPWLWTGLVPHYGPVWTTMIGTPRRAGRRVSRIQTDRRDGVHNFRLAGSRNGGCFRTRNIAADKSSMSLRFHWMMPKGGEVGMKTAQETSRVATTQAQFARGVARHGRLDAVCALRRRGGHRIGVAVV